MQTYIDTSTLSPAQKAARTRLSQKNAYLAKEASLPKTLARSQVYDLPRRIFLKKRHVVIAGAGEDVRLLIGHGVDPANIITCDTDSSALRAVLRSYPGVQTGPCSSIEDTVPWAFQSHGAVEIGSINVDLCCHVQRAAAVLDDVLDSCRVYSYTGRVALTYSAGRDGLSSDAQRCALLPAGRLIKYMSWSATSAGSPMRVLILQLNRGKLVG